MEYYHWLGREAYEAKESRVLSRAIDQHLECARRGPVFEYPRGFGPGDAMSAYRDVE